MDDDFKNCTCVLVTILLAPVLFVLFCLLLNSSSVANAILFVGTAMLLPYMAIRGVKQYRFATTMKRIPPGMSRQEIDLLEQLSGSHTAYVVEAARELGILRSRCAVLHLITILERAITERRSGWDDIASEIVLAFANIRDPRALPVLRKLLVVEGYSAVLELTETIQLLDDSVSDSELVIASQAFEDPSRDLLRSVDEVESRPSELLVPAVRDENTVI